MESVTAIGTEKSGKKIVSIAYLLYAFAFFFGFTAIIAVIINYIKKDEFTGTFLESHFRWQIRTFWFGLLWLTIGVITAFMIIGLFILLAVTIWMAYRIIKGWLRLSDDRPMYSPPQYEGK